MLRIFLFLFLLAAPCLSRAADYQPFAKPELNLLYNLLFCDDLDLFRRETKAFPGSPFATLLAPEPELKKVEALARDDRAEGRYRALAYSLLRERRVAVTPKVLVAVIIEVPTPKGLTVLAAYPDGGTRSVTEDGSFTVFDEIPAVLRDKVRDLMGASQTVVNRIGPTSQPRRPPPAQGAVRFSFLVSDGLYFGEGPAPLMEKDPSTRPIFEASTEILQMLLNMIGT